MESKDSSPWKYLTESDLSWNLGKSRFEREIPPVVALDEPANTPLMDAATLSLESLTECLIVEIVLFSSSILLRTIHHTLLDHLHHHQRSLRSYHSTMTNSDLSWSPGFWQHQLDFEMLCYLKRRNQRRQQVH